MIPREQKIAIAAAVMACVLISPAELANGFKCHRCSGSSCDDPFSANSKGVTEEECSVFQGKPMCMKAISEGMVTRQCMEGRSCTLHGADTYRAWCCDQPYCNSGATFSLDVLITTFLILTVILRHQIMQIR